MGDAIAGDTLKEERLRELTNGLRELALTAGPADALILADVQDWLFFMFGAIKGLESKLRGDAEAVPEKALQGVVRQYAGADPVAFELGMRLARDVRLLCFFPAIERGNA